jgi:hypothetical protein
MSEKTIDVQVAKQPSIRQLFRAEFDAQLPTLATQTTRSFRKHMLAFAVEIGAKPNSGPVEYNEAIKQAIADGRISKVSRGILALVGHEPVAEIKPEKPAKEETKDANKWALVDAEGNVLGYAPTRAKAKEKAADGQKVVKAETAVSETTV